MSAELQRKLDNIIRFGVIAEVNHATARARVKSGDILTEFLPFITFRAGTTKTWSPPTVGEQCVMLSGFTHKTTQANRPMNTSLNLLTEPKSLTTNQLDHWL